MERDKGHANLLIKLYTVNFHADYMDFKHNIIHLKLQIAVLPYLLTFICEFKNQVNLY